ncbi:Fungal domain of unknown function (DUF1712) [Geosmithia morbida]|uniref:CCZ1/INTU/HSP4 first Longin domain-containing protein n=1 Tax=Geosmithia morbida TaxID=1094350 RepID=A0A9P5D593_9HYPO|nr:Fungal domain of unknown function (DUF1712) [Geosmithia morbida]KAF4124321.1 Fungal domain of unknown function (DUF1712) [Geosmithia morbida]
MATPAAAGGLTPARLGFLAIFNPSLGSTDETLDDQIVYYASVTTQNSSSENHDNHSKNRRRRRHARSSRPTEGISQEERHERLRQIGLAQGMANFSRGFAGGAPVDAIDTDKSRVILHELEPGWWILAVAFTKSPLGDGLWLTTFLQSIDLTRIPLPPRLPTKSSAGYSSEEQFEYSTREMKPANLILADLVRAHNTFLLHHDASLQALFSRTTTASIGGRARFVALLSRYWDLYLSTWNVMMHGNPARDVYGGINVAASGELGVGVGEEERGSGEREVLEGLVGRVDGLVDLIVSRFGTDQGEEHGNGVGVSGDREQKLSPPPSWLGTGQEPRSEDGAIFLGTGALSRSSLRDVTLWMQDLYTWGEHAYGVIDSPTGTRRAKGKRGRKGRRGDVEAGASRQSAETGAPPDSTTGQEETRAAGDSPPTAPPVQERRPGDELEEAVSTDKSQEPREARKGTPETDAQGEPREPSKAADQTIEAGKAPETTAAAQNPAPPAPKDRPAEAEEGKLDKMVSYLKMGYGTYWSLPVRGATADVSANATEDRKQKTTAPADTAASTRRGTVLDEQGHFLIGRSGESEEVLGEGEAERGEGSGEPTNQRTMPRTLNVGLSTARNGRDRNRQEEGEGEKAEGEDEEDEEGKDSRDARVCVVVYVNRPFIFTLLFDTHTDSLALDSCYRSLHRQLAPLRKPLLSSTRYRPERPWSSSDSASSPSIYDLVWDPTALTVHSTMPDIPETYEPDGIHSWTRADALNTHLHMLAIHSASSSPPPSSLLERTQKTQRGWWVVWTRLLNHHGHDTPHRASAAATANLSTIHESESESEFGGRNSSDEEEEEEAEEEREVPPPTVDKDIFLVRRASDHVGFRREAADGAGRLAHGIGVDTRRYVEELLTLL